MSGGANDRCLHLPMQLAGNPVQGVPKVRWDCLQLMRTTDLENGSGSIWWMDLFLQFHIYSIHIELWLPEIIQSVSVFDETHLNHRFVKLKKKLWALTPKCVEQRHVVQLVQCVSVYCFVFVWPRRTCCCYLPQTQTACAMWKRRSLMGEYYCIFYEKSKNKSRKTLLQKNTYSFQGTLRI